jgi:hypothetical protein
VIRYLWALPVTLPAAGLALGARLFGARLTWHTGVLEASGGPLPWILSRIYPPMPIAAITLGHVVLAQRDTDLARTRAHERVHVRQYERWGALFLPLYLGESLRLLLLGRDPYRANRFEQEAFGADQ